MKKINLLVILLSLILSFSSIGCKTTENNIIDNTEQINYGMSMYNAFEREFTKQQFDSICQADRISNNLNTWHQFATRDADTREIIVEYLYIKYLNNIEYIYRLLKNNDNNYKITKRIRY